MTTKGMSLMGGWCDNVRLIMLAPRTALELAEIAGTKNPDPYRRLLDHMHEAGLVYRHSKATGRQGKAPVRFAWQPSPFFHPDAC